MRFITEFELRFPYQLSVLEVYKIRHLLDIASKMGDALDWKDEHDDDKNKFTLEIEAFPIDKWIEFKKQLTDALPDYDTTSRVRIINALADLESFQPKQLK